MMEVHVRRRRRPCSGAWRWPASFSSPCYS